VTRPVCVEADGPSRTAVIIERYIIREILKPLLIGVSLLVLIFAGYTSAVFLSDAASGAMQPQLIAYVILLNTVIALGVLLPTALYFSIVFGLGRMHRDSEMVALTGSGVSELRVLGAVFRLALVVALIVGFLSVYGRPWAFRLSYELEAGAMAELDIEKLQTGRFIELEHSDYVLYAEGVDRNNKRLRGVYLQSDRGNTSSRVIQAEALYLAEAGEGVLRPVEFENGYAYLLDRFGQKDQILKFGTLQLYFSSGPPPVSYKRRAEKTLKLAESGKPKEIAEFQWRLSTPLTTILLALLAVPLSRMPARQGRHSKVILAIIVYALLFNLAGVARNWVEQERVGPFPGIWWVYVVPLIVLVILLMQPVRAMRPSRH
jgi:lipopolysaccharide export system permease protein